MPCDDCAITNAQLRDARLSLTHLERVIADRALRPNDDALMVKLLQSELAKLRRQNAELRAALLWHDADA